MNIVESLRKIENKWFDTHDESLDLVGAYSLKENIDKTKLEEMISKNNISGIVKLLEYDTTTDYLADHQEDYQDFGDGDFEDDTPWENEDEYSDFDSSWDSDFDPDVDEPIIENWEFVNKKEVKDSDGFWTEYSMWKSPEGTYGFIFGDTDVYNPDNADLDWECDSAEEAEEWFDNYVGFEDDLEECKMPIRESEDSFWDIFDQMQAIEDKYWPDEEYIEKKINWMYSQHKGDSDWDKAYEMWAGPDSASEKIDSQDYVLPDDIDTFSDSKSFVSYLLETNNLDDYEIEGNLVIFDNEESMKTAEQIFEEAGLHADEYADDTLSVDELDEDDLDESLKESKEPTKDDIIDWLSDHDQAWEDACDWFGSADLSEIDYDDIISWIFDHDTLSDDLMSYFGKEHFIGEMDGLDEDDLDESKSRSEAETLKEETAQKRIASYREIIDNGHVLRSMQKMSNEEAEEAAKEASIKNPNDIYYVQYDDIMNPASDLRWYQGRSYDTNKYDIRYEKGKPVFTPREM